MLEFGILDELSGMIDRKIGDHCTYLTKCMVITCQKHYTSSFNFHPCQNNYDPIVGSSLKSNLILLRVLGRNIIPWKYLSNLERLEVFCHQLFYPNIGPQRCRKYKRFKSENLGSVTWIISFQGSSINDVTHFWILFTSPPSSFWVLRPLYRPTVLQSSQNHWPSFREVTSLMVVPYLERLKNALKSLKLKATNSQLRHSLIWNNNWQFELFLWEKSQLEKKKENIFARYCCCCHVAVVVAAVVTDEKEDHFLGKIEKRFIE